MRMHGVWGVLAVAAVASGCARSNEFSTGALGPVSQGVGCVAEEVQEAGWTVVSRDNAGFVRAENGGEWLQAHVIPGEQNRTHVVEVRISDTPESRDTAEDVLANCS